MKKKDYQKPFLVSESFCASEYIASCDYRATPGGTKPTNIYHDVNSDGKYASGEEVSNFNYAASVIIDLQDNIDSKYVFQAAYASSGIAVGDYCLRNLANKTYNYYCSCNSNIYSTSTFTCALNGKDGKLYFYYGSQYLKLEKLSS